jgi:hypothetical protein
VHLSGARTANRCNAVPDEPDLQQNALSSLRKGAARRLCIVAAEEIVQSLSTTNTEG